MPNLNYADLALGSDGDLDGSMRPVTGVHAVVQRVAGILKTVRGEWFWNDQAGIPWTQLASLRSPPMALLQVYITDATKACPGVAAVRGCTVTRDPETRRVSVALQVAIDREVYGIRFVLSNADLGNTSPYIYSHVLPIRG